MRARPSLRLAIANIHRPGALTPAVILSLGLGLALLVTVVQIDGNLRNQFMAAMPDRAPSFYLRRHPGRRGRRASTHSCATGPVGRPGAGADAARPHFGRERHACRGPQGPAKCRLGAARRPRHHLCHRQFPMAPAWSRANGGAQTTRVRRWCRWKSGSPTGSASASAITITVNVLGRNIEAKLGNLRTLDWESLGINFVLVFSPGTFAGAPHTHLATLTYPPEAATQAKENALTRERGGGLSRGHDRPRQGRAGGHRRRGHQPRGRDPGRQRRRACVRGAGAGRRARGGPSQPGL